MVAHNVLGSFLSGTNRFIFDKLKLCVMLNFTFEENGGTSLCFSKNLTKRHYYHPTCTSVISPSLY